MNEIPTALSDKETDLLQTLPVSYPNVIEVGSLFGYSTLQLAHKANKVISIDPHEGYPTPDAPSTWRKFLNNIDKYSNNNITVIRDYFQKVDIPDADMAFIDLDGCFTTTYQCLAATDHIPLIVVHDFNRQNCEVQEAIKHSNRNLLQVVDTCAILT